MIILRTIPYLLTAIILLSSCTALEKKAHENSFSFEMHFNYPGNPDLVYKHLTGDISDWWDHSFSGDPDSLYIEAWPGGGFYELFDDSGDGVKHAEVIFAKRGEMLRMEGPLGLSGQAVTLVCTYVLEAAGENETRLTLQVHGAGEYSEETPEIVRQVWEHFLFEQFMPYMKKQAKKP